MKLTETKKELSLVDRIVYLASLASDTTLIDNLLDELRRITATHDINSLTTQEVATLERVENELKHYLLELDPIRQFTPETLEQKIYEYGEGGRRFTQLRILLGAICAGAILLASLIAFLGYVIRIPGITAQPQVPAIAGISIIYLGAVTLFLQAVQGFNQELRQAYSLICAGITIIGLLTIQFAFGDLMKDTWWVKNWGFAGVMALAGYLLYLGMRKFARQLRTSLWLTSKITPPITLGIALLISITVPHAPTSIPLPVYVYSVLGLLLLTVFSAYCCMLSWPIFKRIGPLYKKAVQTLAMAILSLAISGFLYTCLRLIWLEPESLGSTLFLLSATLFFLLSGLLFLWASYIFNKTSRS